jgi:beta-lactamase superfamily II metal-dependent hydrolase
MDVFTLYAGQGDLAAVRAGNESIVVDAHMPNTEHVTQEQIEQSLYSYLGNTVTRGLILTGLDMDHACPAGVKSILTHRTPDWVMYPTYFKDSDAASEVFDIIEEEVKRRAKTSRPLERKSVRVDKVESRFLTGLANKFMFELFSPHMEDMDSSNNSSIVLKLTGLDSTGFSYLITGDTETERWERINAIFGISLKSDVMSAAHHGSKTGVHAGTLLSVSADTVLISAGVDNKYGHPDAVAVEAYRRTSRQVYATNVPPNGVCLFTRRNGQVFETTLVRYFDRADAA